MHRIELIDWLSRKRAWPHYLRYLETQWYTAAEIERMQVHKLRALLRHCLSQVPFYRDVIKGAGIDVEGFSDLRVLEQFPIIDKATVKGNAMAFAAVTTTGLGPMRSVHTGGTTGEPLHFLKDAGLRSSSHAVMYRFHEWMGVSVTDPKIVVWGAPIVNPAVAKKIRDVGLRLLTNTRHIDPFTINPGERMRLQRVFERHRPVLIHGYCQAIFELARWFEEWGLRFPLRAISTTVEPLFPEYRVTLRNVFQCEAFDQYGCGEVEMLAGECSAHEGLHVFPERAIPEVDAQGGIVLTDLDNRAFPFIRYRNGDVVELLGRPCSCGRAGLMLRRILGRSGDIVTGVNGNRVHPEFFTHLINELGVSYRSGLRKYQVVQARPDHLEWRLVSTALSADDRSRLIKGVQAYLGPLNVEVIQVHDIPTAPSGKFQYVVSKL